MILNQEIHVLGNIPVSTTEVSQDEPINVEKGNDVVNEEKHTIGRKKG